MMSNTSNQSLIEQYAKLCALKVDRSKEDSLVLSIDESLVSYEQQLANLTATDANSKPPQNLTIQVLCQKYFDVSKMNMELNSQVEDFPRLKLAQNIIDYIFIQIMANNQTPNLLLDLVQRLKAPLMRLTLLAPLSIIDKNNPILNIINTLIGYAPIWKDERKANYPTYGKLATLLNFSKFESSQLEEQLSLAARSITTIKQNQEKRGLIFEKRLVEREAGQAITVLASAASERIVKDLVSKYRLDKILKDFLTNTWARLINLEILRNDENELLESLRTFALLATSLEEVENQNQFDWLLTNLPDINSRISKGLKKLSVNETDANEFLKYIEEKHLESVKKATDGTLSQTNTQQTSSDNSNADEDIIRLKPGNVFAEEEIVETKTAVQQEDSQLLSESSVEPASQQYDLLNAIHNYSITVKDQESSEQAPYSDWIKQFNSEYLSSDLLPEPLEEKEGLSNKVEIDQWFVFGSDSVLNKLVFINQYTAEHIFVNQSAQKSHTLSHTELLSELQNKQINWFNIPDYLTPALKKTLKAFRDFLAKRKLEKTKEQEQNKSGSNLAEVVSTIVEDMTPIKSDKPIQEEHIIPVMTKQENLAAKEPIKIAVELNTLTVGSWVSILIEGNYTKCKLAARIVSKDTYIFVDRRGVKVTENTSRELLQRIEDDTLNLISAENNNSSTLENVIAKTRVLKAES